jgi:hypothetical protein
MFPSITIDITGKFGNLQLRQETDELIFYFTIEPTTGWIQSP